jgi:hypothetical protein
MVGSALFPFVLLLSVTPGEATLSVLPFAPIAGELPQDMGERVAELLRDELTGTGRVRVLEPPAAPPRAPARADRAGLDQAMALWKARRLGEARAALDAVLEGLKQPASHVEDANLLADAYGLSSAIHYQRGEDAAGAEALARSVALKPDGPSVADSSVLFLRLVAQTRRTLEQREKATLVLQSVPPGLPVLVNGRPGGRTPLSVTGLPPGTHLWAVQLPNGALQGGAVELGAGAQLTVGSAPPKNDGPLEDRAFLVLTANRVDAAVLDAWRAHASATKAERVVTGVLSLAPGPNGSELRIEPLVLTTADGAVRRLPPISVDLELLEASARLRPLVAGIADGSAPGARLSVPGQASAFPVPPRPLLRRTYEEALSPSEAPGAGPEKEEPPSDRPRRPLRPRAEPAR